MIQKILISFIFLILSNSSFSVSAKEASKNSDEEVKKAVSKFYHWYKQNEEPLAHFKFYLQVKEPAGSAYRTHNELNWPELERYFAESKKAPGLSEEFLASHRQFFSSCEPDLKTTYDDDVPSCFDYDWMTQSNGWGAEDVLKALPLGQIETIEDQENMHEWVLRIPSSNPNDKSKLRAFLRLSFKKESGAFKITKIDTEEWIETKDFTGVVFNGPHRSLPDGTPIWLLYEKDILDAENLLGSCVLEAGKKAKISPDEKKAWESIAARLSDYKRQYVGIELKDTVNKKNTSLRPLIQINLIDSPRVHWRKKLYRGAIDGIHYASVYIDLKQKRCDSFGMSQ